MSQIKASHILLMYAGSQRSSASRSKEDAEREINRIKGQIEGGDSFEELARTYSDCPSGQSGGDLGSFGKGQMVPPFEQAAYALEIGGLSGVVETDFGYHLIKRTG